MEQQEFIAKLRSDVELYRENFRNPSASFLIWYLVNFFRIDPEDAKDSICDNKGDKGIDGIWVDETSEEEEIYLFQSKFSPNDNADQGDNDLRNFVGAKSWFADPDHVQDLMHSTANKELRSIIERLRIIERVTKGCRVNAVFVTNKIFDRNAKDFLQARQNELEGYDFPRILNAYSYVAEEEPVEAETTLNLVNNTFIDYGLPEGGRYLFCLFKQKNFSNWREFKTIACSREMFDTDWEGPE